MRRSLIIAFGLSLSAASALAQVPVTDRGYVEAVAESAFGNVTSQSFGAEIGVTVRRDLQVFGSFGNVRDVATAELSGATATIAKELAQLQPAAVSYSVKEPVTFFVGGLRYRIAINSRLEPYISGGAGVATVKKDVKFLFGGTDATSTLAQYVTLGSDISGDESKLMFTVGAGVVWPMWRQLIADLHYQYGRISTDTAITVNRAGVGIGVKF